MKKRTNVIGIVVFKKMLIDDRKDIPDIEIREFNVMALCGEVNEQIEELRRELFHGRMGDSESEMKAREIRKELDTKLSWLIESCRELKEIYRRENL